MRYLCFRLTLFALLPSLFFAQAPDTLWTKIYGGAQEDCGYSVQQTTDRGYIVAGYTGSYGSYDVYLIKTDSLGDTLWTKTYGGANNDVGYSVEQTTDKGYIIAGYAESFGPGPSAVYLIKTDSLGDSLWARTYGGTGWDLAYAVQQTPDNGYIVTGGTSSFGAGGGDVYLIKIDSLGNTLWTKTYGGTSNDLGYSVQQTADKGYIITGRTESFGAGSRDVYIIRTDSLGAMLWEKTCGGIEDEEGRSVQQTTDGGYIIAGFTWSFGAGYWDVYLIKVGPDTLGIEETARRSTLNALGLQVYPNPFHDKVSIVLRAEDKGINTLSPLPENF